MTDDERREVARRLKGYVSEWRDMPSFSVQKGVACSLGIVRFDVESQLLRLADLIEPSEPKVKCVAEVKVDGERLERLAHDAAVELTGVDRDALLELAEDVAESAAMATVMDASEGAKMLSDMLLDIARRIREAFGEVES